MSLFTRVLLSIGLFGSAGQVAIGETIVGEVRMWGGAIAATPTGWLLCDGTEVSRTTYPELFAAIGTIYGAGDGSTTFSLPDFRDRSPMGAAQDDGGVPKTNVSGALTQSGGAATHTLVLDEMPSHVHLPQASSATNGNTPVPCGRVPAQVAATSPLPFTSSPNCTMIPTTPAGGDQPHNNLHPYLAVTYIIAAQSGPGTVPAVGEWGLIISTILVLTAGTVVFVRRQSATA